MKTEVIYFDNIKKEITFYIGQTQDENFKIIDMADGCDLWFHAQDISSCHVVALISRCEKLTKKETHTICKAGALLCKQNTNKLKSMSNVCFIYTTINNIVKLDIPGSVTTKSTKTIII